MIPEMLSVIRNYCLWNTKMCDDMVEKEVCKHFTSVVKCRHHLNLFSKVIICNTNITMPPDQLRVTCHKVDTTFRKRITNNNGMQWSGRSTGFRIIYLACMTLLNREDAVAKDGRQEVTNT